VFTCRVGATRPKARELLAPEHKRHLPLLHTSSLHHPNLFNLYLLVTLSDQTRRYLLYHPPERPSLLLTGRGRSVLNEVLLLAGPLPVTLPGLPTLFAMRRKNIVYLVDNCRWFCLPLAG